MRRPLFRGLFQTSYHDTGRKETTDEFQYPLILGPGGKTGQKPIVIDPIEKFGQIDVNHIPKSSPHILTVLTYSIMLRAIGPESEA